MSRRRKSLVAVLALVLVFLLVYITGSYYSSSTIPDTTGTPDEDPNQLSDTTAGTLDETPETPNGLSSGSSESSERKYTFVVPEIPLGTIGVFSAFALSFGMFALSKRNK